MRQIWVLLLDELSEMVRRKKALFAFVLYGIVVGLVVWGFSQFNQTLEGFLLDQGRPKMEGRDLLSQMGEFEGKDVVDRLLQWPITFPLFQICAAFWMAELIALVSCDMISRDRERGTLRFLFLRTTREVYFIAKYLAHLLVFVAVHSVSLLALAVATWIVSGGGELQALFEPTALYMISLLPLIACATALTLLASCLSRTVVGSLFIVHLLWFPIFIFFAFQFHWTLSWQTLVGLFAPFGDFLIANVVGWFVLSVAVLVFGFLVFRRAEV